MSPVRRYVPAAAVAFLVVAGLAAAFFFLADLFQAPDEPRRLARAFQPPADMFRPPPVKVRPPRLAVETESIDFGVVEEIGEDGALVRTIVVRNTGGGVTAPVDVNLTGHQGLTLGRKCTEAAIGADQTCEIEVIWRPVSDGEVAGAVTLSDDSGKLRQVNIKGRLEGPPPPPPPSGPSELELAARAAAAARRQGRGAVYARPAAEEETPAPEVAELQDPDYGSPKRGFGLPVRRSRVITRDRYIPAVLETGINSQIGGRAVAVVSRHVYGADDRYVLIPAGTRAVGDYGSLSEYGDTRLAIRWTRLIRPDGAAIVLEGLPAADQMGRTGMIGHVDTRVWHRYGAPLLLTAISALAEAAAPTANQRIVVVQDDFKKNLNDVTAQIIEERLKLEPIITISAGARLNIIPTHDLWLREPTVLAALPAAPIDDGTGRAALREPPEILPEIPAAALEQAAVADPIPPVASLAGAGDFGDDDLGDPEVPGAAANSGGAQASAADPDAGVVIVEPPGSGPDPAAAGIPLLDPEKPQ